MKPGGSKKKGSQFEREVCKILSLWVTHGRSTDVFWRSAMSGGRATIHGVDVRQCGDICSVAPEGHVLTDRYLVECKHVRNLSVSAGLLQGKGLLAQYWIEACSQAARHGKHPLLIAKQNNAPIIICAERGCQLNAIEPIITAHHLGMVVDIFDNVMKRRFKL
jgi:hypothetical protein